MKESAVRINKGSKKKIKRRFNSFKFYILIFAKISEFVIPEGIAVVLNRNSTLNSSLKYVNYHVMIMFRTPGGV